MNRDAFAGFSAGTLSTLILHPLDLIKIKYQTGASVGPLFPSLGNLYYLNGFRGFYQGLSINLIGSSFAWGAFFYFYKFYQNQLNTKGFVPASLAGVTSLLLTNPLWVAKTRICSSRRPINLSTTFTQIYKQRAFYRGFLPGLFGVSQGAVQMAAYEKFKSEFNPSSPIGYIASSVFSKILAILVTYPYQVVRSRMQMSSNGFVDTFKILYLQGSFYKGLFPAILRVLPGTVITFLTYEVLSK